LDTGSLDFGYTTKKAAALQRPLVVQNGWF
jgi:hypothetical protein